MLEDSMKTGPWTTVVADPLLKVALRKIAPVHLQEVIDAIRPTLDISAYAARRAAEGPLSFEDRRKISAMGGSFTPLLRATIRRGIAEYDDHGKRGFVDDAWTEAVMAGDGDVALELSKIALLFNKNEIFGGDEIQRLIGGFEDE